MKKRNILLAAAMMCLTATAQQLKYQYAKPTSIKAITSRKGGVYMRRTASTKAARLMHGCLPETDDCTYMWSNEKDPDYEPQFCMVTPGDVYVSIGAKAGFDRINVGNNNYSVPVYVAQSVTSVLQTEPITWEDVKGQPWHLMTIDKGPYEGMVIACETDDLEGWSYLLAGSIVDGKLIFSHSREARLQYDSKVSTLQIDNDLDECVISFGPVKAMHVESQDCTVDLLDLNRLSTHEQAMILRELGVEKRPNYLEIYVKVNGRMFSAYKSEVIRTDEVEIIRVVKE